MVLAKPICNKNGLVLLAENTELTDTLIEKIRDTEIPGVLIQGMTQPDIPREEALAALNKRFRNVEKEPYMDLLKQALREHIEELYG